MDDSISTMRTLEVTLMALSLAALVVLIPRVEPDPVIVSVAVFGFPFLGLGPLLLGPRLFRTWVLCAGLLLIFLKVASFSPDTSSDSLAKIWIGVAFALFGLSITPRTQPALAVVRWAAAAILVGLLALLLLNARGIAGFGFFIFLPLPAFIVYSLTRRNDSLFTADPSEWTDGVGNFKNAPDATQREPAIFQR